MRTKGLKSGLNMLLFSVDDKGQIIIEYALMFAVIVIVIIYAATHYIQPSVNHLFRETGVVINNIADDFVSGAYTWD